MCATTGGASCWQSSGVLGGVLSPVGRQLGNTELYLRDNRSGSTSCFHWGCESLWLTAFQPQEQIKIASDLDQRPSITVTETLPSSLVFSLWLHSGLGTLVREDSSVLVIEVTLWSHYGEDMENALPLCTDASVSQRQIVPFKYPLGQKSLLSRESSLSLLILLLISCAMACC